MMPWYLRRTIMYPLIIGAAFVGVATLVLAQAGCSDSSGQTEPAPVALRDVEGATLIGEIGDCDLYEVINTPNQLGRRIVWITRCPNDVAMTVLNP